MTDEEARRRQRLWGWDPEALARKLAAEEETERQRADALRAWAAVAERWGRWMSSLEHNNK